MKNLLIVGGTGRNVGKTEFVCGIIRKIAAVTDIYALKVSTIFPDERLFHGNHADHEQEGNLYEETRTSSGKDTSRMLRAGAKRVFYLRSDDSAVLKGFEEFLKIIPENSAVICESNSLGTVVEPALRIMVRSVGGEVKPRAVAQLACADLVVISDGKSGFPEIKRITMDRDGGWRLLDNGHPEKAVIP